MVQWSGLLAFTAEGAGSIPGLGTKIPQAAQHSQIHKTKQNLRMLPCVWPSCCWQCAVTVLVDLVSQIDVPIPVLLKGGGFCHLGGRQWHRQWTRALPLVTCFCELRRSWSTICGHILIAQCTPHRRHHLLWSRSSLLWSASWGRMAPPLVSPSLLGKFPGLSKYVATPSALFLELLKEESGLLMGRAGRYVRSWFLRTLFSVFTHIVRTSLAHFLLNFLVYRWWGFNLTILRILISQVISLQGLSWTP